VQLLDMCRSNPCRGTHHSESPKGTEARRRTTSLRREFLYMYMCSFANGWWDQGKPKEPRRRHLRGSLLRAGAITAEIPKVRTRSGTSRRTAVPRIASLVRDWVSPGFSYSVSLVRAAPARLNKGGKT